MVSQSAVLYSPYYGAAPYVAYPTLAKSTITYKTSGNKILSKHVARQRRHFKQALFFVPISAGFETVAAETPADTQKLELIEREHAQEILTPTFTYAHAPAAFPYPLAAAPGYYASYPILPAAAAPAVVAPLVVAPAPAVAPLEAAPLVAAPVEAAPLEAAPVEAAPAEAAPLEAAPAEAAPIEAAPVEAEPLEAAPVEAAPVEAVPVEAAPVEAAPIEAAPTK